MSDPDKTPLDEICAVTGCTEEQVRQVVGMVMATLHRTSCCDEQHATAAVRESMRLFGVEACYHLSGVLEQARLHADPGDTWWTTSARYAPGAWIRFGPVVDRWREQRSEARRELDASVRPRRGRSRSSREQLALDVWDDEP